MYRIYCGDRLIYDSTQADVNPILSGNASLEDNRSGTLKFTLLKDHPDLSYMTRMAATIRLYGEETEPIFVGRIVNDVTDFNGNRAFTCEGELSFFMDSIQRPFDFGDSPENYFKYFINQHNLQVSADRQFTAGTVTVTDPNNYISRSNSFYETTWENMQSRLLSPLGGHLVAVHTASGTTLNWLAEYPDRTTQEIRFGENLLGVQKKLDSAQIATAIIPLGASYTDSNDQEHRLTIEEVNDGEDYIYNQEAVAQYGWIFKVVTWDDVTIAANLLAKAQAYLEDAVKSIVSIELSAADLSALDHDIKEFRLGDMVHIVSEPHGIDDEYLLTKQTIDLLHPEANTITLGYTYRTFTGNAANIGKTAAAARGIALAQSARVDAVHERAVDAQEVAAQALPKFGECRSTAGTQNKVNYQTISGFVLEPGATVALLMKEKNSVNNPTLNINGTGAKPIVIADGTAITEDNSAVIGWDDESLVQFVYDGTNWRIDDCAALTRIQHILTEDIVGDHGWINLKDGFFNFDNKLIWDIVSGSTPTLSVEGNINATSGTIGGFTANGTTLYKDTTINSKTHRAYIQAPVSPSATTQAFGVRNVTDTDPIFYVQYNGKLFAKDAEITGTISTNNLTATGGSIGGWSIGANVLTSSGTFTLDNVSTPYSVFMQAPAAAVPGHAAFAVRFGEEGSYTYPFLVQYNGTLTATKANITGTISGSTITGSTISGSNITGETIDIVGTGNVTNGTSTYNKYRTSLKTEDAAITSGGTTMTYKTVGISGRMLNSSSSTVSSSSIFADPNGTASVYGSESVDIGIIASPVSALCVQVTSSSVSAYKSFYAPTIYENNVRLNQKVSGMAADGSAKSINASTWTSFDDTYTLTANHRYLVTYNVDFAANASGYRLTRATINGSTAGNISTQRLPAISGQNMYVGATFWIQASSSSRTLGFDAYHTASAAITGTLRYQVIDFGT